ncbi:hypothetical protein ACHAWX_006521 [Stephanocyclus meneghinianus]
MSNHTPHSHSMEHSLLHTMLHERDAQIASLLHQLHTLSDNITSLQKDLHLKSQQRKLQRDEHMASIQTLKEEHAHQRNLLARYEQNIKGTGGGAAAAGGALRIHEYAALMKAANNNRVESSYVVRLQAQLCRAMHSLGVMESQLALVKENCSSLIRSMKEDLSRMVDDRTRREVELMNTLAVVDAEKRAWQIEMEKKLRQQEDLLESVRDEYEELGLEYDEEEVRRALEVQMLREQVERVKKDKEEAEKELLEGLLEREDQIGRLKEEVEGLGKALRELRGESSRGADNDRQFGEREDSVGTPVESDVMQSDSFGAEKGGAETVKSGKNINQTTAPSSPAADVVVDEKEDSFGGEESVDIPSKSDDVQPGSTSVIKEEADNSSPPVAEQANINEQDTIIKHEERSEEIISDTTSKLGDASITESVPTDDDLTEGNVNAKENPNDEINGSSRTDAANTENEAGDTADTETASSSNGKKSTQDEAINLENQDRIKKVADEQDGKSSSEEAADEAKASDLDKLPEESAHPDSMRTPEEIENVSEDVAHPDSMQPPETNENASDPKCTRMTEEIEVKGDDSVTKDEVPNKINEESTEEQSNLVTTSEGELHGSENKTNSEEGEVKSQDSSQDR